MDALEVAVVEEASLMADKALLSASLRWRTEAAVLRLSESQA